MSKFWKEHKYALIIALPFCLLITAAVLYYFYNHYIAVNQVTYNQFMEYVTDGKVEKIEITLTSKNFCFY